jgi:hypothetical protein
VTLLQALLQYGIPRIHGNHDIQIADELQLLFASFHHVNIVFELEEI